MKQKTAALYARFSSDLQKDRSIDDQYALCETYAKHEGFAVVARFADRAKSGATLFDRDGIMDIRNAAKRGEFNAIIVENLDRLCRDQEDLAGLFKRLSHYGVKLLTVNEGETTSIHVGVRGIVGSMFLKDLAGKVKRGHNGIVREGKVPGAVTYGYDRVFDEVKRKYIPGERVVNKQEAKVIQRIFEEYAAGTSPREIAEGLTRGGIPTPSGGKIWNHQTFVGGSYARGIIRNRMYIGEIVWNTHHTVRDPDTGAKLKRVSPESEHIAVSAPELRIIDQNLWDRAQAVRTSRSLAMFGPTGRRDAASAVRPVISRTPQGEHLLAGLLRCAACNGHMRIAQKSRNGSPRVACAAAHQHGTCAHSKSYDMAVLERSVLNGFRDNLLDPEPINEAVKAFRQRYKENERKQSAERIDVEKKLNRLVLQIERLVTAVCDNDDPLPASAWPAIRTVRGSLRPASPLRSPAARQDGTA